jgi:hypothetical protein
MSRSGKVYEIGHRRPPEASRWKKGKGDALGMSQKCQ